MNNDKVLLAVLKERQSARGNRYLAGWLGKARLIAFLDGDAPEGETIWQVYAQAPEDRERPAADRLLSPSPRSERQAQQRAGRLPRHTPRNQREPVPAGELDDQIPLKGEQRVQK